MANLQIVIMAAGLGSRYGGLKQIDEFGPSKEFLMDYAIYDAYQAGLRRVCVVVRESFKNEIQTLMESKWKSYKDLAFDFVCQETMDIPAEFAEGNEREKPWGTAHVLYVLRKQLNTPFIIMNADDFYGRAAIQNLTSFMREHEGQHALVSYRLQETLSLYGGVTRGICEIKNDKLVAIDEVSNIQPNDPRDVLVSMNLWGFSPNLFSHIEESFKTFLKKNSQEKKTEYQIPQIINDLLLEKKITVSAIPIDSAWFGVTYQEDKVQVQEKINALIAKGVYPKNLFEKGK